MRVYLVTLSECKNLVLELSSFDIVKLINPDAGCLACAGTTSAIGTSIKSHDLLSWTILPNPCKFVILYEKEEFSIINYGKVQSIKQRRAF